MNKQHLVIALGFISLSVLPGCWPSKTEKVEEATAVTSEAPVQSEDAAKETMEQPVETTN